MENINIFSERLKIARQNAKLTQKQLADMSNVTAATISSYESENGTKVPALDKVIAIAKALNVSIDWLCGLENKSNDNNEIGFDEVMKALSLLLTIQGVEFEKANSKFISAGEPHSAIMIYSNIINEFLCEYNRISDFVNDTEYPEYLKDGLKKAVFEKFSKYYIENETKIICAEDGNICDNITGHSNVPF